MVSTILWGGVSHYYKDELEKGLDVRPTIAVTQAHLTIPEIQESLKKEK